MVNHSPVTVRGVVDTGVAAGICEACDGDVAATDDDCSGSVLAVNDASVRVGV